MWFSVADTSPFFHAEELKRQRIEKQINPPREYRAAFSYDDQNSGYLIIDGKKRAIRRITIDGEEFYYIFPQIE